MTVHHDASEMNVLFVHSALDDYPLTPEEFRVYAHLARRAKDGKAYPGVASMAEVCRIHQDTAKAVVRRLESYGLLRIEQRGHLGQPNLYHLTPRSAWKTVTEVLEIQTASAAAGKAKRAARTPTLQTTPPETKAPPANTTPPKRRVGRGEETKGGEGGETKAPEGNPTRLSIQGNPETHHAAGAAVRVPEVQQSTPASTSVAPGGSQAQVQPPATDEQTDATSTEEVPPAPSRALARLMQVYNDHRGELPSVQVTNEGREKHAKKLVRTFGSLDQAAQAMEHATREVAQDSWWHGKGWGFDILLPKVAGKAEAWRARQSVTPGRYDDPTTPTQTYEERYA